MNSNVFKKIFTRTYLNSPVIMGDIEDFWRLLGHQCGSYEDEEMHSAFGINFGHSFLFDFEYESKLFTNNKAFYCSYYGFDEEVVITIKYFLEHEDRECQDIIATSTFAISKMRLIGEMFLVTPTNELFSCS